MAYSHGVRCHSLEEILLAVDAVAPAEALLRQLRLAVAALQALAVPVAIQHFEDEAVDDVLIAACAHRDFCRRQAKQVSNAAGFRRVLGEGTANQMHNSQLLLNTTLFLSVFSFLHPAAFSASSL